MGDSVYRTPPAPVIVDCILALAMLVATSMKKPEGCLLDMGIHMLAAHPIYPTHAATGVHLQISEASDVYCGCLMPHLHLASGKK